MTLALPAPDENLGYIDVDSGQFVFAPLHRAMVRALRPPARDPERPVRRQLKRGGYDPTVSLPPHVEVILEARAQASDLVLDDPWLRAPDPARRFFCGRATIKSRVEPPREVGPEAFWACVERGALDACWPWTGTVSGDTPVFKTAGASHTALRYGWSLVHGRAPDDRRVRRTCRSRGCMNPAHWALGRVQRMRVRVNAALGPHEKSRFAQLVGLYPMRELARTFGLTEREGWSLLGRSPARVAELRANAAYVAQRNEEDATERAINRNRRAAEHAALLDELRPLRARGPTADCVACGREVPVKSAATVEATVDAANRMAIAATLARACGWCGADVGGRAYAFTLVPTAATRAHFVAPHALRLDASVAPVSRVAARTQTGPLPRWDEGVRVYFAGRCSCGHAVKLEADRWVGRKATQPNG